jgi:hypothetical protein
MKQAVRENHTFKPDGSYYTCGEICCDATPGYHRLISSTEKSIFDRYGVGVVLYFKFVKHMIWFFAICMLLSVPALFFYIASYIFNAPDSTAITYSNLLAATTIAGVGYGNLLP